MKIIYVGKFELAHRTENYIRHGLKSLGHRVVPLPVDRLATFSLDDERLTAADVVLFGKTNSEHAGPLIERLRGRVQTVCWQHDLYGIRARHPFPAEYAADVVVSTDGDAAKHSSLADYHVIRQGIHEPEAYHHPAAIEFPVVFVGNSSRFQPGRSELVSWLAATYGSRFRHVTNVQGTRLNDLLARSAVVVGDSYPSPWYWSNRIYEITGRGGFFLHPVTPGLDAEFTDGEHYVSYRRGDFDGLRATINRYLSDVYGRERIRRAGHELTRDRYTYRHRCETLIQTLGR